MDSSPVEQPGTREKTPLDDGGADLVYRSAVVCAALAFLLALALAIWRPFILYELAIPLVVRLFRSGTMLTPQGVEAFQSLLGVVTHLAVLLGMLLLAYACIWRYFARRLPAWPSPQSTSVASRPSALEILCLAVILIIAFMLRLPHLTRGLGFDELTTVMKFVDLDSIWKVLSTDYWFNNHLANSLLGYYSAALFGRSEWAWRLPAFLLGMASLGYLWLFVRKTTMPTVAMVATLGLALSPAHTAWSISARGYTGMILFTLVSSHLFLNLLHTGSVKRSILWVLANVTAVYFHLFSLFVPISQFIFLLCLSLVQVLKKSPEPVINQLSFRNAYLFFPVTFFLVFLCYAPLFLQYYFTMLSPIGELRGNLKLLIPVRMIHLFSSGLGNHQHIWWIFSGAVFASSLIGFMILYRLNTLLACYLIPLFILPFIVIIPFTHNFLNERFLLFLLPYYVMLIALSIMNPWDMACQVKNQAVNSVLRLLSMMLAVAVFGIWAVRSTTPPKEFLEGFREVATAMEREATESTGLCAIGSSAWRLQHYLKRPFFIPRSTDDFQQFMMSYPEIRCAGIVLKSPMEPAYYREIEAFLARRAEVQHFRQVVYYTYRR